MPPLPTFKRDGISSAQSLISNQGETSHIPSPPHSDLASSSSECCSPVQNDTLRSEEFDLLDDDKENNHIMDSMRHQIATSPLVTRQAYDLGFEAGTSQYGVLGSIIRVHGEQKSRPLKDPRLYVNTNAPFSAVVCGVQGSGKSHTVSVLLESMLISGDSRIGTLLTPLSGLVLHFGEAGAASHPCEAAWVGLAKSPGVQGPNVTVYVSPASLERMKRLYAILGDKVVVEPLLFTDSELDANAFLSLMAVGSSDSAPLYMKIILKILRELGDTFTYKAFQRRLEVDKLMFNQSQLSGLEQRMGLLQSFLASGDKKIKVPNRFVGGKLTIVDLTDPFIDSASACALFEIVTRLFQRAELDTGKVLVVDEAHKYLSDNNDFTKSLKILTREQRHIGIRVIISTQEPSTIPSVLLDLCSFAILHRFSSPAWWEHVAKHFSANFGKPALDQIVTLQNGQAIVLAPFALTTHNDLSKGSLCSLGRQYWIIRTRRRITKDGGASKMVLESTDRSDS